MKSLVRGDCVIVVESDLDPNLQLTLPGKALLGLVDGRITSQMCEMSVHLDLECLIGTKALCHAIPGWAHDIWSIQQCN
jgi:hypothetical protein